MQRFRDIHKGKDIFVFGSGPSTHFFDLSKLGNGVTLAVNAAVMKLKGRTDYFFSSDEGSPFLDSWKTVMEHNFPVILNQSVQRFDEFAIDPSRITYYQKHKGEVLDRESNTLIFGISSTHCAAHLANIMGAKRIILVGCDCSSQDGNFYYWNYPGESPDHFNVDAWYRHTPECKAADISNNKYDLSPAYNYWYHIKQMNPRVQILAFGSGRIKEIFPEYRV